MSSSSRRQQSPSRPSFVVGAFQFSSALDREAPVPSSGIIIPARTGCVPNANVHSSSSGVQRPSRPRSPLEDDAASTLVELCSSLSSSRIGNSGPPTDKETYFPVVLMSILSDPSHSDVITWTPDGLSFVVLKPYDLAENVLPRYFEGRAVKYCSFTRKMHRYGFRRTTAAGHHLDAFAHGLFRRDMPELCRELLVVGGGRRSSSLSTSSTVVAAAAKKKKMAAVAKRVTFALAPPSPPVRMRSGLGAQSETMPSSYQKTSDLVRLLDRARRQAPSMHFRVGEGASPPHDDHLLIKARDNNSAGKGIKDGAPATTTSRRQTSLIMSALRAPDLHKLSMPTSSCLSPLPLEVLRHRAQQLLAVRDERARRAAMLRRYDPSGEAVQNILKRAMEVIYLDDEHHQQAQAQAQAPSSAVTSYAAADADISATPFVNRVA